MSVAELHPEELFDKLADGTLNAAERERLLLHLKSCAVCRFEHGARLDFEREAAAAEQRIAPSLPLQPRKRAPAPVRRRPSRILVAGIAAAVLISASGALAAALGARPWRAFTAMFVSAPERPKVVSALPPAALPKPRAADRAQPPVTPAPAPAFAEPAPVSVATPALKPRAALVAKPALTSAREAASPAAPPSSGSAKASLDAPASQEPSGAAKLFGQANQARRAGEVGRASGLYHLLQEQYPGSAEAELSRVTLATLLLNSGDASGALAGFERYLAGPSRALEAEALVGRARALARLGRTKLELTAWREVERRFPGSVYARQAAERLTALETP